MKKQMPNKKKPEKRIGQADGRAGGSADLLPVFIERAGADDLAFDRIVAGRCGLADIVLSEVVQIERRMAARLAAEIEFKRRTARDGVDDEPDEPRDQQKRDYDRREKDREKQLLSAD